MVEFDGEAGTQFDYLRKRQDNYNKIDDCTWQCIYCGRHGESCTRVVHEEGCQLASNTVYIENVTEHPDIMDAMDRDIKAYRTKKGLDTP